MDLKIVMALIEEDRTEAVIDAARGAGATGATVITSVRGEGLKPQKTFLGLDINAKRDVVLFVVAATRARDILETIGGAGRLDEDPGAGLALQIPIEDAVGLTPQLPTLFGVIEDEV